jgi:hypothetical protein
MVNVDSGLITHFHRGVNENFGMSGGGAYDSDLDELGNPAGAAYRAWHPNKLMVNQEPWMRS